MKKFVLLIVSCLACIQFVSAQNYQGDVNFAYGIGVGEPAFDGWNIQTVHGYRFNDYLFVGGGVGLIKYSDISESIIPVFANVKGYLGNSHLVNPFVSLDLGYGIREEGGVYFSPAIGINIRAFRRLGVFVSVGYQYAKMLDSSLGNINLRIGFCF